MGTSNEKQRNLKRVYKTFCGLIIFPYKTIFRFKNSSLSSYFVCSYSGLTGSRFKRRISGFIATITASLAPVSETLLSHLIGVHINRMQRGTRVTGNGKSRERRNEPWNQRFRRWRRFCRRTAIPVFHRCAN